MPRRAQRAAEHGTDAPGPDDADAQPAGARRGTSGTSSTGTPGSRLAARSREASDTAETPTTGCP
ncbi:hypothetical protein ATM99_01465, partial [Cellulomonas sp. B6]